VNLVKDEGREVVDAEADLGLAVPEEDAAHHMTGEEATLETTEGGGVLPMKERKVHHGMTGEAGQMIAATPATREKNVQNLDHSYIFRGFSFVFSLNFDLFFLQVI